MNYEITFISRDAIDDVKKSIENLDGSIIDTLDLGRKKFAYPIKKESAGLYTSYVFTVDSEKLNELEKKLRLNNNILRFLITQTKLENFAKLEKKETITEKFSQNKQQETKNPATNEPVAEEKVEIKEKTAEEEKPAKSKVAKEKKETSKKQTTRPVTEKKEAEVKKPKKQKEVDVTEEERLKALEDKLSALLKD